MALVEKGADFVPNFEVRDSRANSEDFSRAIGSRDLGKLEWKGVLSLAKCGVRTELAAARR